MDLSTNGTVMMRKYDELMAMVQGGITAFQAEIKRRRTEEEVQRAQLTRLEKDFGDMSNIWRDKNKALIEEEIKARVKARTRTRTRQRGPPSGQHQQQHQQIIQRRLHQQQQHQPQVVQQQQQHHVSPQAAPRRQHQLQHGPPLAVPRSSSSSSSSSSTAEENLIDELLTDEHRLKELAGLPPISHSDDDVTDYGDVGDYSDVSYEEALEKLDGDNMGWMGAGGT